MVNLREFKFGPDGLIPAIVQDVHSMRVLTVAYMNRESLEISMEEGYTCFWSRSRNMLWRKGETSGNRQRIISISADCDLDALLVIVDKAGPACHTGSDSCFFETVFDSGESGFSSDRLYALLAGRKAVKKEGSYTSYLFDKGIDKILKKIGEESTEVIIAGKGGDKKETVFEIADLAYHLLVLMAQMDITPDDIRAELAGRHVVDHKVKQEKLK